MKAIDSLALSIFCIPGLLLVLFIRDVHCALGYWLKFRDWQYDGQQWVES